MDARYVTRASRDQVRHIKRKLERTYGHGLVGLIHPVTREFNHGAVIEQRGGRWEHEKVGNTKDIGLEWLINQGNHMVGAPKTISVQGKTFDAYDIISFIYGGIIALQDTSTKAAAQAQNQCFLSTFETVTQIDYMLIDINNMFDTGRIFNVFVFDPIKIWNNAAAAYE